MKVEQMLSEDYIELDLKDEILQELGAILDKTNKAKENEMNKKLYNLHKKKDTLTDNENQDRKCFVNLSDRVLTKYEEEFLNLGLNFHLKNKYSKFLKKVNMEILYQDIMDLSEKDEIVIQEGLATQLRAEAMKHRFKTTRPILSKELINAANSL